MQRQSQLVIVIIIFARSQRGIYRQGKIEREQRQGTFLWEWVDMQDNHTPNLTAAGNGPVSARSSGQQSAYSAANGTSSGVQRTAPARSFSGCGTSTADMQPGTSSHLFSPQSAHAPLHVILIERRTVVRDCLSHILRSSSLGLDVFGVGTIKELQDARADLVLLGLERSPAQWQSLKEQLYDIKRMLPGVPIVAITDNEDAQYLREALKCGVSGIVPTTMGVQIAIAVIELALAGGHYAPSDLMTVPLRDAEDCDDLPAEALASIKPRNGTPEMPEPHPAKSSVAASPCSFTFREQQILEQLKLGTQNKLIAYNLGISENTVKTHLRNIMKKLHATNRTRVAFLTQDPHFNLD